MKRRLFSLFYGIFLFFFVLFLLPRILFQALLRGKYRRSWRQRFGLGLPADPPSDKVKIWVHAVSVGEAKAVIPLIQKMNTKDIHWIISSLTETGYDEVARSMTVPFTQLFLPLDFKCIIRPLIDRWKPDLVLISETDLWYQFLQAVSNSGAPIILVNGKVSEKSASRLKKFPFVAQQLYFLITHFCVQTEIYAKRFIELGVPPEKVTVTGNLKWDQQIRPLQNPDSFRTVWGIAPEDFVVVVGSTHTREEALLLEKLFPLLEQYPHLKLVVVPRHPERFQEVKELIAAYQSKRIILIDRMGILTDCYQIASVVVLGGSFVEGIGGHNILEPIQSGTTVVFGPFMHNQEEMVNFVLASKAGIQAALDTLQSTMRQLISDSQYRQELNASGAQMKERLKGSSDRVLKALRPWTESIFDEELAKKKTV